MSGTTPKKTKINRSGLRILRVLETVNTRGSCSLGDVAEELELSRATTYRYLETLCSGGYLLKDEATHQFHPTRMVRGLSCGFEEESWVRECSIDELQKLSKEFVWPLAVSTLSGSSMLLRSTTDARSPLAVTRSLPGQRVGIVNTASGMTYLAFLSQEQRQTILQILARSDDPKDAKARNTYVVRRELLRVRKLGYARSELEQATGNWEAIAVPIFAYNRVLAVLSVRYAHQAINKAQALPKFLPQLQAAAIAIGERFEAMSNAAENSIAFETDE
ncbi:MAG: IclR family mhp operon transcriptional activator [Halieaceae bacterium]|jgi:IclR family mhp operon transcriptional activator